MPEELVSPAPSRLICAGERVDLGVVAVVRGRFVPVAGGVRYGRLPFAGAGRSGPGMIAGAVSGDGRSLRVPSMLLTLEGGRL